MRIVIKVGTTTLTHPSGHLNIRRDIRSFWFPPAPSAWALESWACCSGQRTFPASRQRQLWANVN